MMIAEDILNGIGNGGRMSTISLSGMVLALSVALSTWSLLVVNLHPTGTGHGVDHVRRGPLNIYPPNRVRRGENILLNINFNSD